VKPEWQFEPALPTIGSSWEARMKHNFLLAAVWLALGIHSASAASCKAQATEKKLAGAALASFMTKCETDAKVSCEAAAQERKLVGAAKASYTKKCAEDAVGN
jgi:hypothetical protein